MHDSSFLCVMGAECMQGLKFQYLEVYVNFYDIVESLSAILNNSFAASNATKKNTGHFKDCFIYTCQILHKGMAFMEQLLQNLTVSLTRKASCHLPLPVLIYFLKNNFNLITREVQLTCS